MAAKNTTQVQEAELYSYRIASADLKYIEINTREVYLRSHPERGPLIQGEIPECGPTCYATLSEIFLEHAMSCKGCEDEASLLGSMAQFGARLGEKLTAVFHTALEDEAQQGVTGRIFECVVESMGAPYSKTTEANILNFTFTEPPFERYAEKFGMHLYISPALYGFVVFLDSLLKNSDRKWTLRSPKAGDVSPLRSIRLQKSS